MYKVLWKIMTFQKLAKTDFGKYLVIFQYNTLKFPEKYIAMVMI